MPTALITGPTSGIGWGFAAAFARRGFDLVLVARDSDRLHAAADSMSREYGVGCEVQVADLAIREDVDRVAARLSDPERPIAALVNNAGFGLHRSFLRTSVDDEQAMLDVMVTAVLRLTHAAVPGMVDRGFGIVLNVGSIAAWIPGGTYSAAKSWLSTFSESLGVSLNGTGVRVTAVTPGFVRTEFHERAGMDMSSTPAWMWLEVADVVDEALTDVARRRAVSVAGPQYKLFTLVLRHGPSWLARRVAGSPRRPVRREPGR